ncbi:MAG TPA: BlaI/MecI/CopY family transcriptional regulator [Candidatus Scatomorpha gallistercoris]|nr:BlaI/MecI/CopY family transcriptional regulator [Candidatus Scatomorpha gallistercoris]
MGEFTLGAMESRFADMIWAREPVSSTELVKLAAQELGWKKSTTYTVLKRLSERGLFVNDGGTVRALISRSDYYAERSERFVDESFSGSLPAFLAAFTSRKQLTDKEIDELQSLIDNMRG